ncbi:MAG TPA: response regulator [Azospirillaceae bacterium]|nr:response regulator [Azospirillaceae bacterium]
MTLLIVDDHQLGAEALATLLRMEGYVVQVAHDGHEALRLLQSGYVPSLIVLDLVMPVMDGRAFRRAQLADPMLADIPVYVFSTLAADEVVAELKAAGGRRKPCPVPLLLADIAELVGMPGDGAGRSRGGGRQGLSG